MVKIDWETEDRRTHLIVLKAIASDKSLGAELVLKGAFATEAVTKLARSTKDLDLTARSEKWAPTTGSAGELKKLFESALRRHFRSDELRTLEIVTIKKNPKNEGHPFGWDSFDVKITVSYKTRRRVTVDIDLSFGDFFGPVVKFQITDSGLTVDANTSTEGIYAYSAEQIIAEKLRAFLQKLPSYSKKIGITHSTTPRVRDLRDICAIHKQCRDTLDWGTLADCFTEKCRRRSVDCRSSTDFHPDSNSIELFQNLYINEKLDFSFDEAWTTTLDIVKKIETDYKLPGTFPPPVPKTQSQ